MRNEPAKLHISDDEILAAAEAIHLRRLERQGRISEPTEAAQYIRARCGHADREVFGCLFLDSRHQILACEDLFYGTIDSASVHPREIVRAVIEVNAACVILAHNHPSGDTEPSVSDKKITQRIVEALGLIDVRVLDHIVLGNEAFSFAENNLL